MIEIFIQLAFSNVGLIIYGVSILGMFSYHMGQYFEIPIDERKIAPPWGEVLFGSVIYVSKCYFGICLLAALVRACR